MCDDLLVPAVDHGRAMWQCLETTMNRHSESVPILSPPVRLACVMAAAVCAAVINGGLLDLFDKASSERWLRPTPQLLSAKSQCDALAGRAERTHCAQALVARTLAANERTQQVAAR
jgi:hypothetical protein